MRGGGGGAVAESLKNFATPRFGSEVAVLLLVCRLLSVLRVLVAHSNKDRGMGQDALG